MRTQIDHTNAELQGCPRPREHRALSGGRGTANSVAEASSVWSLLGSSREKLPDG